jgi:hypothetical protein
MLPLPDRPPIPVEHAVLASSAKDLRTGLVIDFANFIARRWLFLVKPIRAGLPALAVELVAEDRPITYSYLFANTTYKRLRDDFNGRLPAFMRLLEPALKRLIVDAGDVGQAYAANTLKLFTSESFKRMARKDLEKWVLREYSRYIAPGLADDIYTRAWTGLSREMIHNLRKRLPPETIAKYAIDRGMGQGLNHILLVARDQALRAFRDADLRFFRDTGAVEGFQRFAQHNDRVCMLCLSLDGKVYGKNETPELHAQDQCDFLPILIGQDPYQWLGGEEWLKTQPAERQQAILGPARYRLFRNGARLDSFRTVENHPVWGPTLQEVPLKNLQGE